MRKRATIMTPEVVAKVKELCKTYQQKEVAKMLGISRTSVCVYNARPKKPAEDWSEGGIFNVDKYAKSVSTL